MQMMKHQESRLANLASASITLPDDDDLITPQQRSLTRPYRILAPGTL